MAAAGCAEAPGQAEGSGGGGDDLVGALQSWGSPASPAITETGGDGVKAAGLALAGAGLAPSPLLVARAVAVVGGEGWAARLEVADLAAGLDNGLEL
jgi:hypothetical protein